MANEKSITLDNLRTFKTKADATYAKKTDITTSCIYVGKASEKSNSATTNGNTYLKLFDNDTKRSQHLINGGGATTVTSNAGGTITVATPIKNLDTTSSSKVGDGSSENIAGSGTIYLHKVAKTGKLTDLSERTFSNISSRGEEYLEWGGPAKSGAVSPIGVAMSLEHSANRLALINPDALTFEYSSDGGTTWTAYSNKGTEKTKFCTSYLGLPIGRPDENTNLVANKSKTRITITAQTGTAGYVYVSLRKLLVNVSSATTLSMLLERRTGANYKSNGSWETIGTYSLTGWSGWNDIPLSSHLGGGNTQTSNYWQMRMTITCTTVSTTNPKTGQVRGIRIFGENCWIPASTLAETGHLYSYNMDGHATFPNNVYAHGFYATGTISTTNGSVSGLSFIEGGKKLSEKYLGISAKAADSLKLDGHSSSYYLNTNTEQFITGKKCFETDLNFGKYVSPIRNVSDAPANLHFMNSAQTTGVFFDTVILAGAGDWLYLGHLKPDFSIRASFRGTGDENDTYSASLGYTHGTLNTLTDWDYQGGWCVRPTKVSATTPAIIQIKFTKMLYTDVLRLILTGHNLNDSSGNYSGFLDDYTIEVCTDYTKDTWTTVVNRTNASDNIGKGLIYAMQTGSYTTCYGIRLKITKCHVNGNGYAFIKITSMQLRDYRPGIKFPDCLGAISQGGGDVWGELYTKSNLVTHNVLPYATNQSYIGNANSQYWSIYSHDFYENGTNIADKYLSKGTSSTNVSQDVWGELHTKSKLVTHHVYPEVANSYILGSPNYPYAEIYGNNFYENGTALSDKYLAKGYLERLSPKLYRHTIKIEGYNERTTGIELVCMLQVDSSFNQKINSFEGLATVLGSIDKETGEPIPSLCMVTGGVVAGAGDTNNIIPLIRLETDGTVNGTVFFGLINEYPDLTDANISKLTDYSTVTYTDYVIPVP